MNKLFKVTQNIETLCFIHVDFNIMQQELESLNIISKFLSQPKRSYIPIESKDGSYVYWNKLDNPYHR